MKTISRFFVAAFFCIICSISGLSFSATLTPPFTLEAPQFENKGTATLLNNNLALYTNTVVSNSVTFTANTNYKFDVTAFGTAAQSVYPTAKVLIDGVVIKTLSINSATQKTFSFNYTVKVGGTRQLKVQFTNDLKTATEDRDLFINSVTVSTVTPQVIAIYSQDFPSSAIPSEWHAYNGGSISIIGTPNQTFENTGYSLKANYPKPPSSGEVYALGEVYTPSITPTNNHVYIDFYAKMPNSKQGLKFVKIFGGEGSNGGYANMTFGLDYTGIDRGGMVYVAFADGTYLQNDTNNGVWLAGSNDPEASIHGPGRSVGLPGFSVSTPQNMTWNNWGTGWHRFQFHVKFNSGTSAQNEVNDGEIDVIIDGVTFVKARGLYNRHFSNPPIDRIHFLEYAQSGTSAFDIWIDSIRVSQVGWTR